jgi:hypothetical protein
LKKNGPSREHCLLWMFASPNSISHYLKLKNFIQSIVPKWPTYRAKFGWLLLFEKSNCITIIKLFIVIIMQFWLCISQFWINYQDYSNWFWFFCTKCKFRTTNHFTFSPKKVQP